MKRIIVDMGDIRFGDTVYAKDGNVYTARATVRPGDSFLVVTAPSIGHNMDTVFLSADQFDHAERGRRDIISDFTAVHAGDTAVLKDSRNAYPVVAGTEGAGPVPYLTVSIAPLSIHDHCHIRLYEAQFDHAVRLGPTLPSEHGLYETGDGDVLLFDSDGWSRIARHGRFGDTEALSDGEAFASLPLTPYGKENH